MLDVRAVGLTTAATAVGVPIGQLICDVTVTHGYGQWHLGWVAGGIAWLLTYRLLHWLLDWTFPSVKPDCTAGPVKHVAACGLGDHPTRRLDCHEPYGLCPSRPGGRGYWLSDAPDPDQAAVPGSRP